MNKFVSNKKYPDNLENDWDFYIDIEKDYSPYNNHEILRAKYNVFIDFNYYNYELNYELNYDKNSKKLNTYDKIDNNEKIDKRPLFFYLGSVTTLVTTIVSCYCIFLLL